MRIGIIGTGFGQRVVAPSFAATPGCEVVEVVSARDANAVSALTRRNDLDLVAVHSPPFLHTLHVRQALEHDRAILCDKPFGLDAGEAAALFDQAKNAGVVHALNFEFRYHPARVAMRRLITEGAIGTPQHLQWIHVTAGTRVPLRKHGWLFERVKGGGWIGAWASHAVDTIRWMFDEIEEVSCQAKTLVGERPDADGVMQPCDAEDSLTARLRCRDGFTATLDSTFAAPANLPARITVIGTDGVLENTGDLKLSLRRADGTKEEWSFDDDDHADRHTLPMRTWAAVLRDAVNERRPVEPSFADGVACAVVLDAMRAGR